VRRSNSPWKNSNRGLRSQTASTIERWHASCGNWHTEFAFGVRGKRYLISLCGMNGERIISTHEVNRLEPRRTGASSLCPANLAASGSLPPIAFIVPVTAVA
jgi:hypothetical protein